ncbi:helix-turn-helix domain-containing protein [Streptomyces chartreusis]|uniref:helix-turn-helix domain-containing protein n=1 Tax=Streptomyces chartreusis TaxID=1969 RepID=UPI003716F551
MPRAHTGEPDRPFAPLAAHLIGLRRAARLTQRALTYAANVSRGAVQRAESGTTSPTTAVLEAYLRACTAGPAETARARLLRRHGRTIQRNRLCELKAPAPALIHTEDDLAATLAAAYERAGAPPLRDLSLPGRAPVPPTTAWRIVNRKGLPTTVQQMLTFLTACGVSPAEQRMYTDAYHRITANRSTRTTPPTHARRWADQVHLIVEGHPEQHDLAGLFANPVEPTADQAHQEPTAAEAALARYLHQRASREAHRNGTTAPAWITATNLISHGYDRAIDLIAQTPASRTVVFEVKSLSRHPHGHPPEAHSARTTPPPPPQPTPTARAA